MAAITATDLGSISSVAIGVYRNGPSAHATPVTRESSIPAAYHWIPLARHGIALIDGVDPLTPADTFPAHFRATYANLILATVAGLPDGTVPADLVDAINLPAHAQTRLRALALAAARAATEKGWAVTNADIRPAETAPVEARVYEAVPDPPNRCLLRVLATAGNQQRIIAQGVDQPTDAEKELVAAIMLMAVASAPLAGAALDGTGHHFVSTDLRRVTAVEKQVMPPGTEPALWLPNKALLQDMIWHKAIHPVLQEVLLGFAMSNNICQALKDAKLGSAAVGLPVKEGVVRTASAYMEIIRACSTALEAMGHTARAPRLEHALAYVNQVQRGDVAPAGTLPRARRITEFLEPAIKDAAPVAAFCYGYFKSLTENAPPIAAGTKVTLTLSNALMNAATSQVASYYQGTTAYGDDQRSKRQAIQDGNLVIISLTDGAGPDLAAAAMGLDAGGV